VVGADCASGDSCLLAGTSEGHQSSVIPGGRFASCRRVMPQRKPRPSAPLPGERHRAHIGPVVTSHKGASARISRLGVIRHHL